jgi:hypothetical protein
MLAYVLVAFFRARTHRRTDTRRFRRDVDGFANQHQLLSRADSHRNDGVRRTGETNGEHFHRKARSWRSQSTSSRLMAVGRVIRSRDMPKGQILHGPLKPKPTASRALVSCTVILSQPTWLKPYYAVQCRTVSRTTSSTKPAPNAMCTGLVSFRPTVYRTRPLSYQYGRADPNHPHGKTPRAARHGYSYVMASKRVSSAAHTVW